MIDKQYVIGALRKKQEGTKGLIYSTYESCIAVLKMMPDEPDQSRRIADLRAEITEYQEEISNLKKEAAMRDHQIAALRAEAGILGTERLLLRDLLKDQLTRHAEEGGETR